MATIEQPKRQAPPIAPARNLAVQGPGVGLGILGGVSVVIWPNQRWVAYCLFAIGLGLLVWPSVAWASSVIRQYVGVRSMIFRRSGHREPRQLIRAIATLLVILVGVGFAGREVVRADRDAKTEQAALAAQERAREALRNLRDSVRNALIASLNVGRALLNDDVESEDEFYDWMKDLGTWQQDAMAVYDTGIRYGVLNATQKGRFSLSSAGSLGPAFNPRHGRERGHLFARLEVLQQHVDDLEQVK